MPPKVNVGDAQRVELARIKALLEAGLVTPSVAETMQRVAVGVPAPAANPVAAAGKLEVEDNTTGFDRLMSKIVGEWTGSPSQPALSATVADFLDRAPSAALQERLNALCRRPANAAILRLLRSVPAGTSPLGLAEPDAVATVARLATRAFLCELLVVCGTECAAYTFERQHQASLTQGQKDEMTRLIRLATEEEAVTTAGSAIIAALNKRRDVDLKPAKEPVNQRGAGRDAHEDNRNGGRRPSKRPRSPPRCRSCNSPGHLIRDCPRLKQDPKVVKVEGKKPT